MNPFGDPFAMFALVMVNHCDDFSGAMSLRPREPDRLEGFSPAHSDPTTIFGSENQVTSR